MTSLYNLKRHSDSQPFAMHTDPIFRNYNMHSCEGSARYEGIVRQRISRLIYKTAWVNHPGLADRVMQITDVSTIALSYRIHSPTFIVRENIQSGFEIMSSIRHSGLSNMKYSAQVFRRSLFHIDDSTLCVDVRL